MAKISAPMRTPSPVRASRLLTSTNTDDLVVVGYLIPREFLRVTRADSTGFVHRFLRLPAVQLVLGRFRRP